VSQAKTFTELFGELYLHLHPRRAPGEYAPSRESMALLHHLAVSGPLSVKDMCKHFDRSQAAMSERIERLVKRGLLARQADESDRRLYRVWLTELGQAQVSRESEPIDRQRVERALAALSVRDRQQLMDGLHQLADVVRAQARQERTKRHGK